MNKGSTSNLFEDFRLGQEFECPTPRVLTDADRVAYIVHTGDRTPHFCNARGIVHPLIVFHTVLGQTVRQISLNARANLGYAELMWHKPVFVGDEVRTSAKVIGLKENSDQKSGIVFVKTVGVNQRNESVLEYMRWVMVKKNRESATPYLRDPVAPNMAKSVTVDKLSSHSPDPCIPSATGGRFFWEDYAVGEVVFHEEGTTVNSSDHMNFTRLYQNSARVHFDSILTNGKPLVYGGLPLSVGYAHQFNGFENRSGIAAINGGSHVNPTYSGDTLYSCTQIVERSNFSPSLGALRLRLIVCKNENPASVPDFQIMRLNPQTQKEEYRPSVVLDLDFWELVGKKSER